MVEFFDKKQDAHEKQSHSERPPFFSESHFVQPRSSWALTYPALHPLVLCGLSAGNVDRSGYRIPFSLLVARSRCNNDTWSRITDASDFLRRGAGCDQSH